MCPACLQFLLRLIPELCNVILSCYYKEWIRLMEEIALGCVFGLYRIRKDTETDEYDSS